MIRPSSPAATRALSRLGLTGSLLALLLQVCQAQPAAQEPLAEQLTHLALVLPSDAFEQSLRQHLASGGTPQQISMALHQTLLNLRSQPPSSAGRWLVDYLMTAPLLLLAPHPERAAIMHDPLGLSSAAQGTRNTWSWRRWRQLTMEHGRRGSWQLLDELTTSAERGRPADQAALRGAAAGIRQLQPATLMHPDLEARLLSQPSLAPLTLSVAEVTGTEALLLEASRRWPAGQQAALTLKLATLVGADKALTIWRQQLATTGPTQPYARQAMVRLLEQGALPAEQSREIQALLEQSP